MASDNSYRKMQRRSGIPSNRSLPTYYLSEAMPDEEEAEASIFQSRLANARQYKPEKINAPLRTSEIIVPNRRRRVYYEVEPHRVWPKLIVYLSILILIGLIGFLLLNILPLIWSVTTLLGQTITLFASYIIDRFKSQDTTNILQNIASLIVIITSIITFFTLIKKRTKKK